jgi:hypothetical protein
MVPFLIVEDSLQLAAGSFNLTGVVNRKLSEGSARVLAN